MKRDDSVYLQHILDTILKVAQAEHAPYASLIGVAGIIISSNTRRLVACTAAAGATNSDF